MHLMMGTVGGSMVKNLSKEILTPGNCCYQNTACLWLSPKGSFVCPEIKGWDIEYVGYGRDSGQGTPGPHKWHRFDAHC